MTGKPSPEISGMAGNFRPEGGDPHTAERLPLLLFASYCIDTAFESLNQLAGGSACSANELVQTFDNLVHLPGRRFANFLFEALNG